MDHSEAVKLRAAEKYLLGELAAEQREEYEEHYFACSECAAEVKAGATLVDNARELLRTEFPAPSTGLARTEHSAWFAWFRPAFALAAALLLAILLYQNLATIPSLRREVAQASTPQTLASFSFVTSGSRGATPLRIKAPLGRPFGIYLDIPAGSFAEYTCEIRDESEAPKFSVVVPAEQARETVQLLIPASRLGSGRYALVVRGRQAGPAAGNETEVARFPFALELEF